MYSAWHKTTRTLTTAKTLTFTLTLAAITLLPILSTQILHMLVSAASLARTQTLGEHKRYLAVDGLLQRAAWTAL